eukprot:CFRG0498T1
MRLISMNGIVISRILRPQSCVFVHGSIRNIGTSSRIPSILPSNARAAFSQSLIQTTLPKAHVARGQHKKANFCSNASPKHPPVAEVTSIDEIVQLSAAPQTGVHLIDVRSAHETDDGFIPSAIKIPLPVLPDAFRMSPEDFMKEFNAKVLSKEDKLIFYCRSGVRSQIACNLAREAGYSRVSNFRGSWLQWADRISKH